VASSIPNLKISRRFAALGRRDCCNQAPRGASRQGAGVPQARNFEGHLLQMQSQFAGLEVLAAKRVKSREDEIAKL